MRRLFFIIFLATFLISLGEKTIKVNSSYTYYVPETMSVEEAKQIALERAKIEAIANEFGTVISQNNTTLIANKNGNSSEQFYSSGGSDIKGEWIETIGQPEFDISYDSNLLIVKCKVKGKIREFVQPEINLSAKVLKNGDDLKFESYDFKDGDDLYLYFYSSHAGNIIVFLRQGDLVYRLLPYKRSLGKTYKIDAHTPYILFSKRDIEDPNIDNYRLYAETDADLAEIIILFTPALQSHLSTKEIKKDEPEAVNIHDFNKWISQIRGKDIYSRLLQIPLFIRKS